MISFVFLHYPQFAVALFYRFMEGLGYCNDCRSVYHAILLLKTFWVLQVSAAQHAHDGFLKHTQILNPYT